MGKVFLDMAMSLDGFICGPNGEDGGLHDWYFKSPGAATGIVAELLESIGAIVMGRRAFGSAPDGFDTPYQVPHFILTHGGRPRVERGGASFTFVTDGIGSALAQAREAAGDRDVCIAGGADTARQYLGAGLVEELHLHLVPTLFSGGVRLFEHLGGEMIPLERLRVTESAHATHLRFRVVKP